MTGHFCKDLANKGTIFVHSDRGWCQVGQTLDLKTKVDRCKKKSSHYARYRPVALNKELLPILCNLKIVTLDYASRRLHLLCRSLTQRKTNLHGTKLLHIWRSKRRFVHEAEEHKHTTIVETMLWMCIVHQSISRCIVCFSLFFRYIWISSTQLWRLAQIIVC